jgi:hypothetical protein
MYKESKRDFPQPFKSRIGEVEIHLAGGNAAAEVPDIDVSEEVNGSLLFTSRAIWKRLARCQSPVACPRGIVLADSPICALPYPAAV